MNSDSEFVYDKKYLQKNNSSFLTGENTSTIHSNIKNSFNKSKSRPNLTLKNIANIKYLNSTIFTHAHKNKTRWMKYTSMMSSPSSNASKDNNFGQLYLTEAKNTIIPSYNSKTKNKYINYYRNKKKNKLPKLKCYSHHNSEIFPEIFTCGDFQMKPKLLAKLYYKQNKAKGKENNDKTNSSKDLDIINDLMNKKKNNKKTTREYLNDANMINFLNYNINSKKEALKQYEKIMKSQIEGLDYTISKIQDYKANFENNYYIKYDEEKRELEMEIKERKYQSDMQKKILLDLIKEVGHLSQVIIKKQAVKKNYDKWLMLQVLIKEGREPKCRDIKEYIEKKYDKKNIFDNNNDFFIILKEKEQNDIRLIAKSEKIIEENSLLIKDLDDLNAQLNKRALKASIKIKEKEYILNIIKQRNKKLNEIKSKITSEKSQKIIKISKSSKNYRTYLSSNKYRDIDIEKDLKLNKLGAFGYNFEKVININKMIYCIYNSILKNKIKGLNISFDTIYKIDNTLSKIQKALSQIKIIEYALNYLNSSIKEKTKDKTNKKIIDEVKEQIDLYHKTVKAKLYEEERNKKNEEFINKINEKKNKVYLIPKKKYDRFPFYLYNKKKNCSVNKNKKKKLELFDFLFDENSSEEEK